MPKEPRLVFSPVSTLERLHIRGPDSAQLVFVNIRPWLIPRVGVNTSFAGGKVLLACPNDALCVVKFENRRRSRYSNHFSGDMVGIKLCLPHHQVTAAKLST